MSYVGIYTLALFAYRSRNRELLSDLSYNELDVKKKSPLSDPRGDCVAPSGRTHNELAHPHHTIPSLRPLPKLILCLCRKYYVQAMNAILAPLYYVCTSEAGKDRLIHFFVSVVLWIISSNLMFECIFIITNSEFQIRMDSSSVGVHKTLGKLDYELWTLESKGLTIELYTLQWILLLVSQEFDFPDVCTLLFSRRK
ncbi:hypothetical protein Pelo_15411 [Pelomyxa schiedti]|nr:hypothetical protein Pelo_15411 [Pelomyxa schiedti]